MPARSPAHLAGYRTDTLPDRPGGLAPHRLTTGPVTATVAIAGCTGNAVVGDRRPDAPTPGAPAGLQVGRPPASSGRVGTPWDRRPWGVAVDHAW